MFNNPQMSEYFTNSNTYNFSNFDTNEFVIYHIVHNIHVFYISYFIFYILLIKKYKSIYMYKKALQHAPQILIKKKVKHSAEWQCKSYEYDYVWLYMYIRT